MAHYRVDFTFSSSLDEEEAAGFIEDMLYDYSIRAPGLSVYEVTTFGRD